MRIVPFVVSLLLAAPVAATPLPFQGEVGIVLPTIGVIVSVSGNGLADVRTNASGLLTALDLPAGVFATSATFPGSVALRELHVAASNGAGAFAGLTAHGGGGTMPVQGIARLCLLAPCSIATLYRDLALSPVGAGGTAMVTGAITITLDGARWTKGGFTITAPGLVSEVEGFAAGPGGLTGSTAQPGGVLSLVTPIHIHTSLPGLRELPGFALLSLTFVPEPGTLALLGAGLVATAIGAHRAQRRS
jgi:hypothetical protein